MGDKITILLLEVNSRQGSYYIILLYFIIYMIYCNNDGCLYYYCVPTLVYNRTVRVSPLRLNIQTIYYIYIIYTFNIYCCTSRPIIFSTPVVLRHTCCTRGFRLIGYSQVTTVATRQ